MHQVHNLIILDESGSMESIKAPILEGFGELVQNILGIEKQFPEQEHLVTFVTFNSLAQRIVHFAAPAVKLKPLTPTDYRPSSMTPLYDTMGTAMLRLEQHLAEHSDYHVLVTILTDGEENSSSEFTGEMIAKKVDELKLKGWTFTYIGTDHAVQHSAQKISIHNVLHFHKNSAGVKNMFQEEGKSRQRFAERVSKREVINEQDFFKPEE